MDMSSACEPPSQPHCNPPDVSHPRYNDYLRYRAAMCQQMVVGAAFTLWLEQTEKTEKGFVTVYEVTSPAAVLTPGWYRNIFAPGNKLVCREGPFATKVIAELS